MSKVFDLPRSFVPRLLRNYINTRLLNGEESLKAASFFFQGACLIVDISGFTALSEGFCDAGKLGIDGLQVCTNGYIGDLVAIVQSHGGDIVKFAGDALICVFCDEKLSSTSRSRKREDVDVDVLLRAMVCAKEVCGVRTDRLTVHVGMSCGEMCFGILGGVENRWECLISGPCIYELSQCLDDAPSMQAVMTTQCVEGIQGHTKTQDTAESDAVSTACTYTLDRPLLQYTIRLETLSSGNHRLNEVTTSTRPQLGGMKKQVSFGGNVDTNAVQLSERLKALSDALIRQFVPAPILEELNGATGLSYFAEIREVVTMFMKWDSYDANIKHRDLLDLQPCFYQAQRILHASGAYLRQFLVDDKGCVLIACWGMPNMSYLDNAHRALAAATQIRPELERLHMETSVGITCADVYCGTVGSLERMEYAAIGSEVNMAARLMGKAKGRLLVGDTAYRNLPKSDHGRLQEIPPLKVKGRSEPLQAYCYIPSTSEKITVKAPSRSVVDIPPSCKPVLLGLLESITAAPNSMSSSSHGSSVHTLGAVRRISFRASSFRSVSIAAAFPVRSAAHPAKVVVVKGKFGTGKSCVASWLRARAAERSIHVTNIRMAKMVGRRMPYTLWKKIFYLMTAKSDVRADGQWSHINDLLHRVFPNMAHLTDYVSMSALCTALGVGVTAFESTTIPAQIKPTRKNSMSFMIGAAVVKKPSVKQEQENLRDAMVKIFAYLFNQQPTLLIIENVHMIGERCLDLLVHLLPKLNHPSAVVLTALIVDQFSAAEQSVKATLDELSVSGNAIQVNALESSPWFIRYRQVILSKKAVTVVVLSTYSKLDISAMLCKTLNLSTAPPELLQLVQEFSGGSYFWVNEILQFIKEHGAENFLSAVSADSATPQPQAQAQGSTPTLQRRQSSSVAPAPLRRSASTAKNQFGAPVPSRAVSPYQAQLDKLVLVRFGGLSSETQRILRTASVIGPSLCMDVLHAVLPGHLQPALRPSLQTLVNQLWLLQDTDNDQLYIFLHPHAQHIIYELTPSSERNLLYAQIAEYVEEAHGTDPAYFPALSHYYLHCDTDKALQYAVKATAVLLEVHRIYDFADAITLLQNSVQACVSASDARVVQRLCENCLSAMEKFRSPLLASNPDNASAPLHFLQRFTSCWGRGGTRVQPYVLDRAQLEENEQAARDEFSRALGEVFTSLEKFMLDSKEEVPDPKRWQVEFLAQQ